MEKKFFPAGKYMAVVKVGPKGQIVIPAEVREMFSIRPGDSLLMIADDTRGIALPKQEQATQIMDSAMDMAIQGGGKKNVCD